MVYNDIEFRQRHHDKSLLITPMKFIQILFRKLGSIGVSLVMSFVIKHNIYISHKIILFLKFGSNILFLVCCFCSNKKGIGPPTLKNPKESSQQH